MCFSKAKFATTKWTRACGTVVARIICIDEVRGSIPRMSNSFFQFQELCFIGRQLSPLVSILANGALSSGPDSQPFVLGVFVQPLPCVCGSLTVDNVPSRMHVSNTNWNTRNHHLATFCRIREVL